jgi:iron complex transport system ATP-binding protein
MNDTPLLSTESLTLQAGGRRLVSELSLQVNAGELWCVLGPNGSGKTSLLHALAGLAPVHAGAIAWSGAPVSSWPPERAARHRALLPQTLHDSFAASALEVVLMGRHPYVDRWSWESEPDRAIALAALRAVDMEALAAREVTSLSGGERQRVAIAAALAQDTPLMLLDEPMAHLDLKHQVSVLQHLRARMRGGARAVGLAIHDLNLARRFATHALLLGTPHRQGRAEDVMTAPNLSLAFGVTVSGLAWGERCVYLAE